jgi:hypothetical protein
MWQRSNTIQDFSFLPSKENSWPHIKNLVGAKMILIPSFIDFTPSTTKRNPSKIYKIYAEINSLFTNTLEWLQRRSTKPHTIPWSFCYGNSSSTRQWVVQVLPKCVNFPYMSTNTYTCGLGCLMSKTIFAYANTRDAKQVRAKRPKIVHAMLD